MDAKLWALHRADPRYAPEAYEFVCEAVQFTQETLGRAPREWDVADGDFHIDAAELARGACDLAVQEFGLMAAVVFKQWGLERTTDIGAVVFHLIEAGKLRRSDGDDPADFRDLFDLPHELRSRFEMTTRRKRAKGPR